MEAKEDGRFDLEGIDRDQSILIFCGYVFVKILLLANTDWYLYNFRLGLAQALRERGDEVVLVSPEGPHVSKLKERGFQWIRFPMERRGMNPAAELGTIQRLCRLYRGLKPDLVHHFTIKCVLYGSMAARITGVKEVVNSVEGLGYVFTEGQDRPGWLKVIIKALYRLALKRTKVVFLNTDDERFFLRNRLVEVKNMHLTRGVGVDLQKFAVRPLPEGTPIIILPARMLWDKGLKQFVEAARLIKGEGIPARFALVGDNDEGNPASATRAELLQLVKEGMIEWWGWKDEMEEVYAQAAIVCLPTFYREGVPKALIEAAACGRPIVASDAPGCREAVRQGENGLLVPMRDTASLADALRQLLLNPELRRKMGEKSRKIAEADFSIESSNLEMFEIYEKSTDEPKRKGFLNKWLYGKSRLRSNGRMDGMKKHE
jgi:glycosyltransferase involved in cell wall biosynthesis